jgi:CTP synthase
MVIEYARDVAGMEKANSAEFDPETPDAVIATMASQLDVIAGERDLGGTMRLGSYPATLQPGSVAAAAYGATEITERHRHRYEVANAYRDRLSEAGMVFSGTSPDGLLVEFAELPADVHPFFVGTQAHPELKSRPTRPHPLFAAFVRAAVDYQESARLPLDGAEEVDA